MEAKKAGGCTDAAPPEIYTAYQLSRLSDALSSAGKVSLNVRDKLWKGLPRQLRMEHNYSKWDYVPDSNG